MISYITHHISHFPHEPSIFVLTGCISHEDNYWSWYTGAMAGCFVTLTYGVVGAVVEVAIIRISGMGTPTDVEERSRMLVPLCKFNMVPMLIIRIAGFLFAIYALTYTDQICKCAIHHHHHPSEFNSSSELEYEDDDYVPNLKSRALSACPERDWYVMARILIFTMACDALFPTITLVVVLRKRIGRCYRRVWPKEERGLEELQRAWMLRCKRCCECSSLMTCYMCGGQKLTAGSYADVALALTDFFAEDSLDIVPSDIAAAMICLVKLQRQKQIDCKNELLKGGGIFARDDKTLAVRLYRQYMDAFNYSNRNNNNSNNNNSDDTATDGLMTNLPLVKKSDSSSMRDVSSSLRRSLSIASAKDYLGDIEIGFDARVVKEEGGEENPNSIEIKLMRQNSQNSLSHDEEEKEELATEDEAKSNTSHSSTTRQPTDGELEQLRQIILTRGDELENKINFTISHNGTVMSVQPTINKLLSPQNPFDCLVLGEGSRYCAVALASYSWMMYMWTNKCTGCCGLTANTILHPRCCCCHSKNDDIVGDNICGWKEATILKSLGIEESDVLYANFSNDVGVNPYLILRDEKWKTIVLAIRGTLSFEDMISDVCITPESLEGIGEEFGFDGTGEYCHSGMLAGAKWIFYDLKKHNRLDEAMEANPDFGLRIIGHSLGAGVAAMLGRLLRKQFPSLYCLCFSPPGCVFSERTAKESRDYVCSYVLHDDIVPRLSYASLANLRNELIEMIARIKVPKHAVFDVDWVPWNETSLQSLPEKLLHGKEEIPESQFFSDFDAFKARQSQRQEEREMANINMTVPGRILHMVRTSTKLNSVPCSCILTCAKCISPCQETKQYKVRWTDAEELSEIYISATMMVDHFPYNVAHALDVAAESYGVVDEASDLHQRERLEKILEGAKKDC